ncbi:MAG: hypothetical protein JWO98_4175 [Frankiales bacterium]|nr:hypothetical protein [Frankiales bacterium]
MNVPRRRRLPVVLAVILGLVAAVAVLPASRAEAAPGCGPSDPVGTRVPLLLVHGFISSAKAWDSAVKRFCSPTVYATAFDYAKVNSNWVTDPLIGPQLARTILALADASRRGGGPGKVLVAAHSMGGLAVRCAADGRCNGGIGAPAGQASPVAQAIAAVTTFDTPNLGTFLKSGGKSLVSDALGPLLSSLCYGDQAANLGMNDLLNGLCAMVRAFGTSAAGAAFTPGSDELANLPAQPAGVPVQAVAGKALLTVRMFWQDLHIYNAGTSDTGDFVVSRASAQAQQREVDGFGGIAEVDCGSAKLSITGKDDSKLKCWHMTETGDSGFLDQVQRMVQHYLTAPLTAAALRSAPVPSLCDFPAGTLVNSVLPGAPPSAGSPPALVADGSGRRPMDTMAFGDLNGDGLGDAAAVVNCNKGGVGWPDNIVFWARGPAGPVALGSYQMGDAVGDARGATEKVTYQPDGSVRVETLDARSYDQGCCPSGRAIVTLKWDGTKVVASDVRHLGGPDDASFAGVGAVKLGMTAGQLTQLGYTAGPGDYYGCVLYGASGKPSVQYNPVSNKVVQIRPAAGPAGTAEGIGIGSTISDVRAKYAGKNIENHLDGSFGQGMNGLLVGDGSGGWISFMTDDGQFVSGMSVSDHQHMGAMEAGCQ